LIRAIIVQIIRLRQVVPGGLKLTVIDN